MRHASLLILAASVFGSTAHAAVQCQLPSKSGELWSHVCSEDGGGTKDYKCTYSYALTLKGGKTATATTTASVARKQQNAVVWSNDRHEGKKIVAVGINSWSCEAKD